MREIYLVIGTKGEYSDRDEWPVMAFFDLSKAEALVIRATSRAKELLDKLEEKMEAEGWYDTEAIEKENEYDPDMKLDTYDGAKYFITKVNLQE